MKGIKKLLGIGALAFLTSVAVPKNSNARDWTADFQNTFASKYVDNGILKDNHTVARPALRFERPLDEGNLNLSALANFDFRDGEFDRVELGADYAFMIPENMNFRTGYVRKLSRKNDSWKGLDVFLGRATFDIPYQPSLEAEFNVNEGSYFGLSAQKDLCLLDGEGSCFGRTLAVGAELGYNAHAFREKTGFSHFETHLKIPITMPRSGFLSSFNGEANVRYSGALADDIRDNWVVELNLSKRL
ncbi:hypothetical protein HYT23_00410 [Candidatus Pacearchaeota archaeon]|nr:hypothetical protein [Candidatus Pacearchaeota archaeon]